jgi:RNA 2',3'-cyclic 3'-phosphodiesterase
VGDTVTVRVFVAAWPPPSVNDSLEHLSRPRLGGVRWTAPDQWHVTLVFLGEVSEPQVKPLAAVLREWGGSTAPATATAGPATRRLGRGVLCLSVRGLEAMALGVRAVTRGFGNAGDDRPFTGHLTLARIGRRDRIPEELVGLPAAADWEVREVRLVVSILGPSGPRYEPLELVQLAG